MKNLHLHIAVRLSKWLKHHDIATAFENDSIVMMSQCGKFRVDLDVSELVVTGTDRRLQSDLVYYHSRRLLRVYRREMAYLGATCLREDLT